MTTAAFIGLGNMGYPMAGHLAAAGHDVRVYNRTGEKAERWAAGHAGTACATPAEAAVAFGAGPPGHVFIVACAALRSPRDHHLREAES